MLILHGAAWQNLKRTEWRKERGLSEHCKAKRWQERFMWLHFATFRYTAPTPMPTEAIPCRDTLIFSGKQTQCGRHYWQNTKYKR
jgi:hypothetical protein